ncbi:DDE Tnp 4 domain containing protein, partial [Asbolus verrucosus]
IRGFPLVLGVVDCTHVKLFSPGGDNAEVFRNREDYFSINVQVVGEANLKIMDIVSRWPASVHDTIIFNDSNIRTRLKN